MADEYKEPSLWCAVIEQAMADSVTTSINIVARTERREAREWFRCNGEDFHYVCGLAGMDPVAVRRVALAVMVKAEPGVVENFDEAPRDRCGSIAHDFPKIEIFP